METGLYGSYLEGKVLSLLWREVFESKSVGGQSEDYCCFVDCPSAAIQKYSCGYYLEELEKGAFLIPISGAHIIHS